MARSAAHSFAEVWNVPGELDVREQGNKWILDWRILVKLLMPKDPGMFK